MEKGNKRVKMEREREERKEGKREMGEYRVKVRDEI